MRKILLIFLISVLNISMSLAFCGFYVAKADATLFNEKSQVILVRDENRSVVTMSNDFRGAVKDFAMVIPVPEVLDKNDIRLADASIFSKFDQYSSPRLVEYYDQNPCYAYDYKRNKDGFNASVQDDLDEEGLLSNETKYSVKVEAEYSIGEYDIVILSAEESDGLELWLKENKYNIPNGANEVLEPYIKGDMKFFVVKVNLEKYQQSQFQTLRPIQITYHSNKFMLPIRLGMANANGNQDLIVYALTKKGRVELTNYRTTKLPSNLNVPTFMKSKFGDFYHDLFEKSWEDEGGKSAFLEYSWDLSFNNYVKCDPCVGPPPIYNDLREAGVYWAKPNDWEAYFTRIHVRYNRQDYAQDLQFQATPNKEPFQGRYVMQHPVAMDLDCDKAQDYYSQVIDRREEELENLAKLTGWQTSQHEYYLDEYKNKLDKIENKWFEPERNSILPALPNDIDSTTGIGLVVLLLQVCLLIFFIKKYLGLRKTMKKKDKSRSILYN
ncbi:MAG: DUF2330 domain-containing protein [Flavobacteriales bacterium]|nr:DUF2330 domain-containing protein [Flavobacteriales bacterium]